jgi:DNA-binding NarL/FixJ family response regulator
MAKTVKKAKKVVPVKVAKKKTTAPVLAEGRSPIRDRSKPAGKVGDIKLIRRDTKQASVLLLMDKGNHVEEIARLVGVPMSEVRHHVANLSKKGVGHSVEGGVVRAVYPNGRDVESFFIQKAE